MQFTLDSIEHVKACLQEKYKGRKVSYEPFYGHINDLKVDEDFLVEGNYYFGIISNGGQHMFVRINKNEVIFVAPNCQIIEFFDNLICVDYETMDEVYGYGHFRGYKINVM